MRCGPNDLIACLMSHKWNMRRSNGCRWHWFLSEFLMQQCVQTWNGENVFQHVQSRSDSNAVDASPHKQWIYNDPSRLKRFALRKAIYTSSGVSYWQQWLTILRKNQPTQRKKVHNLKQKCNNFNDKYWFRICLQAQQSQLNQTKTQKKWLNIELKK